MNPKFYGGLLAEEKEIVDESLQAAQAVAFMLARDAESSATADLEAAGAKVNDVPAETIKALQASVKAVYDEFGPKFQAGPWASCKAPPWASRRTGKIRKGSGEGRRPPVVEDVQWRHHHPLPNPPPSRGEGFSLRGIIDRAHSPACRPVARRALARRAKPKRLRFGEGRREGVAGHLGYRHRRPGCAPRDNRFRCWGWGGRWGRIG